MGQQPTESAFVTAASFRKSVELIREMLVEAGLTVLGESCLKSCRILYVACPFLLLEALAFDRSTAVFVPVQVMVRPTEDGAEARWVNLASVPKLRLPVGAHRPVNSLCWRISQAFDTDTSTK